MRISVAAIAVVGMLSGCLYGPYQFTCTDEASCGPGGKCEPDYKLCSFANPTCPGGRVFGDLGGAYAGQCVGSQPPPGQVCYGADPVMVCFATAPTGTIDIDIDMPTAFDTTTGTTLSGTMLTCATPTSLSSGYCVVVAGDITIEAKLRATGTRPLVLIANGKLDITDTGMIDVGSYRQPTESTGAGSGPGVCMSGVRAGNGSGGAGGSFLGSGGAGGNGNGAGGGGEPGDVSGPPTALRGGCPGQPGHAFVSPDTGAGGHGGGAVFLIAGSSIEFDGAIYAGGEGGRGGQQGCNSPPRQCPGSAAGGGGGGAGGMIGLDAPHIMGTGTLIANGGGGGEGNDEFNSGGDGADAVSTSAAVGGNKGTAGGNGGNGSAGANGSGSPGMTVTPTGDGGGGGGGGAGIIKAPLAISGPNVSPPPTP